MKSKKPAILITGGSGLIGRALRKALEANEYPVAILTRKSDPGIRAYRWDPAGGQIDPEAMEFADVIIHLAGENISGKRWTEEQKNRIRESREAATSLLQKSIERASSKPYRMIAASAIGYYGSETSDHIFSEEDRPGQDFLAETVVEWEKSSLAIAQSGPEVTVLRIGMVLSPQGGVLAKIIKPVQFGLATRLGTGKQWFPWISMEDLVRIFEFVLEKNPSGTVFNAVAPGPVMNRDLMKKLASALNRPMFMPPAPELALRFYLGEMADIVLKGSRVSPEKIIRAGFQFRHADLADYLKDAFTR